MQRERAPDLFKLRASFSEGAFSEGVQNALTSKETLVGTLAGRSRMTTARASRLDPAARNELGKSLVHGRGCANQPCQLFLSQLVSNEHAVGCGAAEASPGSSSALARRLNGEDQVSQPVSVVQAVVSLNNLIGDSGSSCVSPADLSLMATRRESQRRGSVGRTGEGSKRAISPKTSPGPMVANPYSRGRQGGATQLDLYRRVQR